MNINDGKKTMIDSLLKYLTPQKLKAGLLLVGFVIIVRAVSTLDTSYARSIVTVDPHNYQEALDAISIKVPRFVMTVLWPLAFTLLSTAYPGVRPGKAFFTLVLIVHVLSCLWSSYALSTASGYIMAAVPGSGLNEYEVGSYLLVWACVLSGLTVITSVLCYYWFSRGGTIFAGHGASCDGLKRVDHK